MLIRHDAVENTWRHDLDTALPDADVNLKRMLLELYCLPGAVWKLHDRHLPHWILHGFDVPLAAQWRETVL